MKQLKFAIAVHKQLPYGAQSEARGHCAEQSQFTTQFQRSTLARRLAVLFSKWAGQVVSSVIVILEYRRKSRALVVMIFGSSPRILANLAVLLLINF